MKQLLLLNGLLVGLALVGGGDGGGGDDEEEDYEEYLVRRQRKIEQRERELLYIVDRIEKTIAAAQKIEAAEKRGGKPKDKEEAAIWAAVMLEDEALGASFSVSRHELGKFLRKKIAEENLHGEWDFLISSKVKYWDDTIISLHKWRAAIGRGDITPEMLEEIRERGCEELYWLPDYPCNTQQSYEYPTVFFYRWDDEELPLSKKE